jgi:microcystin-dependent protein
MSDITFGEIRLFPYATVIPAGWLPCEGQILTISSNQALFALLGTNYGGDGKTTFALPDLRGRTPVAQWVRTPPDNNRISTDGGAPLQVGNKGGSETVALNITQIPAHNHLFNARFENVPPAAILNSIPSSCVPLPPVSASAPPAPATYATPGTLVPVNPAFIGSTGGASGTNIGHENRQPYIALRFCICAKGYFPSRN